MNIKARYLFLFFVLCCYVAHTSAQQLNIDSLQRLVDSETDPKEQQERRSKLQFYLGKQAWYQLTKLQNNKEALRLYECAFRIDSLKINPNDSYNAACASALLADKGKAFYYLNKAIDFGWQDSLQLQTDSDLKTLHQEAQWPQIVLKLRSNINQGKPLIYWGIYFGVLFMLFFYNLILLFSLRERLYFYYGLFLFLYASVEIARTSFLSIYLPDLLNWIQYLEPKSGGATFCVTLIGIVYLLFSSTLLHLKEKSQRTNNWINRLVYLLGLIAVLQYFFAFSGVVISLFMVLTAYGIPFLIGIRSLRRGYKPARFFVLGNFFFFIGIVWSILPITGMIRSAIFFTVFHPDNVGSLLLFFMLSIALGDSINLLKKEKIEAQEKALEVLEEKVEERTQEVRKQKHIVEEKQKEIIDSITYAKRLQEAILPPRSFVNASVPHNFILYKPKDLVAGDFYWAEKIGDLFYIAAADSTGHGVPGAMVSVVCSNALNRTVKEFKETEPGKILDKTRELVLETFEKSVSEVKDGMDISLLCIDLKSKKISWSGANNPLWYILKGTNELQEIKADKQPIGKTEYPKPFTTHYLENQEGSLFYLFTDGLADQFGGPKGKKFKYKQFSELLLGNRELTLQEQSLVVDKAFEDWKGDLESVDDVCVIGFRV